MIFEESLEGQHKMRRQGERRRLGHRLALQQQLLQRNRGLGQLLQPLHGLRQVYAVQAVLKKYLKK